MITHRIRGSDVWDHMVFNCQLLIPFAHGYDHVNAVSRFHWTFWFTLREKNIWAVRVNLPYDGINIILSWLISNWCSNCNDHRNHKYSVSCSSSKIDPFIQLMIVHFTQSNSTTCCNSMNFNSPLIWITFKFQIACCAIHFRGLMIVHFTQSNNNTCCNSMNFNSPLIWITFKFQITCCAIHFRILSSKLIKEISHCAIVLTTFQEIFFPNSWQNLRNYFQQ